MIHELVNFVFTLYEATVGSCRENFSHNGNFKDCTTCAFILWAAEQLKSQNEVSKDPFTDGSQQAITKKDKRISIVWKSEVEN